ncbi:hypothetical protein A6X21_03245 [Planctopirus hydrillae]|uniref:Uncharacterized protein n=1 Tax=Planctopirus hydrillae TaxID=1841610 RepID=A0A1C3EN83_9PLAN|nr:hypothetical protein A6X21_03245 [Planctopirus hydrillae]
MLLHRSLRLPGSPIRPSLMAVNSENVAFEARLDPEMFEITDRAAPNGDQKIWQRKTCQHLGVCPKRSWVESLKRCDAGALDWVSDTGMTAGKFSWPEAQ